MMAPDEVTLAVDTFQQALSSAGHAVPQDVAAAGFRAAVSAVVEARTAAAVSAAMAMAVVRPQARLDAGQYEQLLAQEHTVSLAQYRDMEEYDANVFWRLDSGDHQNLLDTALEHIGTLARALETEAAGGPER